MGYWRHSLHSPFRTRRPRFRWTREVADSAWARGSLPSDEGRMTPGYEVDHDQDRADEEQDPGDLSGHRRDPRQPEGPRDQADDQEHERVVQHGQDLLRSDPAEPRHDGAALRCHRGSVSGAPPGLRPISRSRSLGAPAERISG